MDKMIKTLIVTGGNCKEDLLKNLYQKEKFNNIIASDRGLEILDKCNITPNYIIGDFDSIDKKILDKYINNKNIKIIKLNPIKDYTDTHMGVKLALEIKSTKILILGATGSRIDHVLGNVHVLKEALDNNTECKIIDDKNEIQLINKSKVLKLDKRYKYVSLIPLTTEVKGLTLRGFKYELSNSSIEIGHSLGISNEQIKEKANIDIKDGIIILIRSKD